MAKFLASKSVWLDSYDASDDTPLHLAARSGSAALCRVRRGGALLFGASSS